jgi:uncharacterized membrane protein
MVTFHIAYDLNEYAGININCVSGFWYWVGKTSALTFIFLAGISSGFSKNTIRRGIKVLAYAMVITIFTYVFFKEQYVRFGILHLLGMGMVFFPLLNRMNSVYLIMSSIIIAVITIPLKNSTVSTCLLLPLGAMYKGFDTLDYYPLIPYLSVFITGIVAYKLYYYKKRSLFKFKLENNYISMISKNSLAIYMIHQPVIVMIIFLLKLKRIT